MIARLGLLLLVGWSLAHAPLADADTKPSHADTLHRYSVSHPSAFVFHEGNERLGSYLGEGGLALSLSRISFPNLSAWRKKERKDYFDTLVAGARSAAKGFQQKSRSDTRVDGVPTLDLHFARQGRAGPELVWMRFLFLRKHTIVASASTPASAKSSLQRQAKGFTRSLGPLADPAD